MNNHKECGLNPLIVNGIEYKIVEYFDSPEPDVTHVTFKHQNGHIQHCICVSPATIKDVENAICVQVKHLANINYNWERRAGLPFASAQAAIQALASERGWRPIEEAPLATDILLYCPDRGITNPERIECGNAGNGRGSYHAWATHWQPLPPPPSKAGG